MGFDINTGRTYETNTERKFRPKKENLGILQWFCRIALALSILIFIDYLFPANEQRERIVDSWHTYGGRHSAQSTKIILESGQKFSIYPSQARDFREINRDGTILVNISVIFGMVLNVVNEEHTVSIPVSLVNSYLVIIPLLMLGVSLGGVLAKNNVELVFNLGSVSLILTIINLVLIFLVYK